MERSIAGVGITLLFSSDPDGRALEV